jgi:hypothetical protein
VASLAPFARYVVEAPPPAMATANAPDGTSLAFQACVFEVGPCNVGRLVESAW